MHKGTFYDGTAGGVYTGQGGAQWRRQEYEPGDLRAMRGVMRDYDRLLAEFEEQGGGAERVREFSGLLKESFTVSGPYGGAKACLAKPDGVKQALIQSGQYDIKFSVRRLAHGFPAYYLSRVRRDYWGTYSLVVEDIHRSPGYELRDMRFARLMDGGRERYFLRLSDFRREVSELLGEAGGEFAPDVDSILYALGRCVFQGAWHTDQRLAFVMARHFSLPMLRQAVELVYLSLSCDLCALRRFLTAPIVDFFRRSYPNPGISRMLERLPELSGSDMVLLNKRGTAAYQQLSAAVNEFLGTPVPWGGAGQRHTPLWKVVFGNFGRLGLVGRELGDTGPVRLACGKLEGGAGRCVDALLEGIA